MPHADRGGEGGDRQRREKGPPILTAEIGEFGARRIAGEGWPIMLRAT